MQLIGLERLAVLPLDGSRWQQRIIDVNAANQVMPRAQPSSNSRRRTPQPLTGNDRLG